MLFVQVNNFSVMPGHFPVRADPVIISEDRVTCSSGSSLIWIHIVCYIGYQITSAAEHADDNCVNGGKGANQTGVKFNQN